MARDGMSIAEVSSRRDFTIAGAFNCQRAAIEKGTADFGQLDHPVYTRFRFLGLHGLFQPADPQFRHRGDQQPGVGMIRWRKHLVGSPLLDHPSRIEHDDFVCKGGDGGEVMADMARFDHDKARSGYLTKHTAKSINYVNFITSREFQT